MTQESWSKDVKDLVYYLEIEGEVFYEECFASEEEAVEYAEVNAIKNYLVVEWDCA
tara:strand:+ start:543 stop:710 length:168 start_codon:yes stop_codon:yes gene_type:complete